MLRFRVSESRVCALESPPHREGVVARVAHDDEAVVLVEGDERGIVALDAEAERAIAVGAGALAQRLDERVADTASPPARDDRDRELGRLLVDEAVPRQVAAEEPVPGGADRKRVVDGDESRVARPPQPFT